MTSILDRLYVEIWPSRVSVAFRFEEHVRCEKKRKLIGCLENNLTH